MIDHHLPVLEPGAAHPHRPVEPAEMAARLRVDPSLFVDWVDRGLPLVDGRCDPFATCDWVTWHALDECRLLARRWRRYLGYFEPFVHGRETPARITWQHQRECFLPIAVDGLRWWLPRPSVSPWQRVVDESPMRWREGHQAGEAAHLQPDYQFLQPDYQFLQSGPLPAGEHGVESAVVCDLPLITRAPGWQKMVREAMIAVIGSFTYSYRQHRLSDVASNPPSTGTCLDCALSLRSVLMARGLPVRVVGGFIAHEELVNGHYWLLVGEGEEQAPVDPSLPAIARMLGRPDWRDWAAAYIGSVDTRRVWLASDLAPRPEAERVRPFMHPAPGVLIAQKGDAFYDAWACQDWACGEAAGRFVREPVR